MTCKSFLLLCGLSFHSIDSMPWYTKVFNFNEAQFAYFSFITYGVITKKTLQ